ncbi:MAG: hypothetical protein KGJ07_01255 [Patescibacteria group bacterium]|nr:hypothetical protein [Patescibacteria group bacterium]MDE2590393.1 hypothetical protein [Patescibacteria group bacterium]
MKNIQHELTKQAEEFLQKVCVKTWEMNEKQVQAYCQMIVKQNVLMSHVNPDYLATAVAYAPFAGIAAEEMQTLLKGGEKDEKTNSIH